MGDGSTRDRGLGTGDWGFRVQGSGFRVQGSRFKRPRPSVATPAQGPRPKARIPPHSPDGPVQQLDPRAVVAAGGARHADLAGAAARVVSVGSDGPDLRRRDARRGFGQLRDEEPAVTGEAATAGRRRHEDAIAAGARPRRRGAARCPSSRASRPGAARPSRRAVAAAAPARTLVRKNSTASTMRMPRRAARD